MGRSWPAITTRTNGNHRIKHPMKYFVCNQCGEMVVSKQPQGGSSPNPTSKTCDTCLHWSTKTVLEQDGGTCDSYKQRHYCDLLSDKLHLGANIDHANDAEAAAHGVGGAAIATGPKFGCLHHIPKK